MDKEIVVLNDELDWIHDNLLFGDYDYSDEMIFCVSDDDRKIENQLLSKCFIHFVDSDFLLEHGIENPWDFDPNRRYYALNQNILEIFKNNQSTILVRELYPYDGVGLNQQEIELLNECLNKSFFKYPLFEGLGYRYEMSVLVLKGVLELWSEKEFVYKATFIWKDYVKAILKDW